MITLDGATLGSLAPLELVLIGTAEAPRSSSTVLHHYLGPAPAGGCWRVRARSSETKNSVRKFVHSTLHARHKRLCDKHNHASDNMLHRWRVHSRLTPRLSCGARSQPSMRPEPPARRQLEPVMCHRSPPRKTTTSPAMPSRAFPSADAIAFAVVSEKSMSSGA